MDFLDALAQTTVGIGGLAALNYFAGGESWPCAWVFATVFMFCFWLGRYGAERFSRRRDRRQMGDR